MPAMLGVRLLATEYSTGPVHGGRIDSLGLDENGAPVVVEYNSFTRQVGCRGSGCRSSV